MRLAQVVMRNGLATSKYDLSGIVAISNGGAALPPTVRDRLLAPVPHLVPVDGVGASQSQRSAGGIALSPSTAFIQHPESHAFACR